MQFSAAPCTACLKFDEFTSLRS